MYYFLRGPWIVTTVNCAINLFIARPQSKDHYALRKQEQPLSVFNFQHSSPESF